MDTPFEALLHRRLHTHDVNTHFSEQLAMVHDIVNYGSNLVPSCFASSAKSLGDVIAITVLLKQVIAMLDSIEVLLANACVPVSWLQVRALFEASVYLDFLLSGEKDQKAEFYYVANVRRELRWTKITQPHDPERTSFANSLGDFADILEQEAESIQEIGEHQMQNIERFLEKEPWASRNQRFEELRGNRSYDVNWYVPFGHHSFRQLSDAVGRLHEYALIYSTSSAKIHGSDYKPHVKFAKNSINLEPIRNLSDIATVLNFSLTAVLRSYERTLREYRPGQIQEFKRRYTRDWQEPFNAIQTVKYTHHGNDPVEL